jgi:hypothetical protein
MPDNFETRLLLNKNEYFPIPGLQIDLSVDAHGGLSLIENPGYGTTANNGVLVARDR